MQEQHKQLIKQAYTSFNARDIDAVLALMQEDVHWPNGWEGGYVEGHAAVRDYWTRQWQELNPNVQPVSFTEKADGQIIVEVHQLAKDMQGNVIFDGIIKHIYTLENDLIKTMEIEKQE